MRNESSPAISIRSAVSHKMRAISRFSTRVPASIVSDAVRRPSSIRLCDRSGRQSMNPERRQQIEQLYRSALEREPHRRSSFLDAACGPDHDLRRHVESLLTGTLTSTDQPPAQALERETPVVLTPGDRLGPYQVVG